MINFENLKEPETGHWIYKGKSDFEVPLGAFGFVYQIEKIDPLPNEKSKYIGRKYLSKAKTTSKRITNKSGVKVTKKKKSRVESDWQMYTGSCLPLNEQIQKLGKDKFKFEILCFCFTKGQVNFAEEFAQMRAGVIFDDSYFNEAIGSGSFRGVKFTSEFKIVLKEIKI
jgi:hypothetical protein